MRQKSWTRKAPAEQVIKDIRRETRKQYGAEENIRVVLEGLRDEESIAALCRREGNAESLYCTWSKEFLEAGKKRLTGDTARAVTSDEVKVLRKATHDLKEVVAGSSAAAAAIGLEPGYIVGLPVDGFLLTDAADMSKLLSGVDARRCVYQRLSACG